MINKLLTFTFGKAIGGQMFRELFLITVNMGSLISQLLFLL